MLLKLNHPNIIMLHAIISERDHHGLLFEYLKHGNLESFIKHYVVILVVFITCLPSIIHECNVLYCYRYIAVCGCTIFLKICVRIEECSASTQLAP